MKDRAIILRNCYVVFVGNDFEHLQACISLNADMSGYSCQNTNWRNPLRKGEHRVFTFYGHKARYVRLLGHGNGNNDRLTICEIRVFQFRGKYERQRS